MGGPWMTGTPHEIFGSLLRNYRRVAGMTQDDLADRAGVSAHTISNIERGIAHVARKETLNLLIEALALTPQQADTLLAAARAVHSMRASTARSAPSLGGQAVGGAAATYGRIPLPPTPLIGRENEFATLRA